MKFDGGLFVVLFVGFCYGDVIRLDLKFVWLQLDFGVIVIEEVFVGVLEVVGNEKGGVVIKGFLMGCIGGVILLGFEDVDNVVVFIRV